MNNFITEEKFNEIYKMHVQELFNISYGYTRNVEDAEDIVQTVFMKYLKSNIEFKSDLDLKYWLIRVTINQSIDSIKVAYRKKVILSDEIVHFKPDVIEKIH